MGYYKKELGRREFFKKAFATAAVAVVPYSIFSEVEGDPTFWQEKSTVKKIDFGDYRAILVRDGAVIAKSHLVNVHMDREIHRINSVGYEWVEYIPGLWSFDIEMDNVSSDTEPAILRRAMNTSDKLEVYIRPAFDDQRFHAECYMEAMVVTSQMDEIISFNIRLKGSGALIIEDNEDSNKQN